MKEMGKQMREDCHKSPKFNSFFIELAKRLTGMAKAFDEHPERRMFFRGDSPCEFRVIVLALKTISSEFPEKREEIEPLLSEMNKRESQIKQMFNLDN